MLHGLLSSMVNKLGGGVVGRNKNGDPSTQGVQTLPAPCSNGPVDPSNSVHLWTETVLLSGSLCSSYCNQLFGLTMKTV